MKAIVVSIITALGSKLATVLGQLFSCVAKIIDFLNKKQQIKHEQQKKEEKKKLDSKIDDVCDNGTVEDLLNL